MKFTLPLPPSINQTYGVNRNAEYPMYKRKSVKDWEFTAGWEIKRQYIEIRKTKLGVYPFGGDVQVGITWFYKTDRDIDAGIKVLFDVLEKQQVILNDRQIRRITHVDIYPDYKNPRVEIEIENYESI